MTERSRWHLYVTCVLSLFYFGHAAKVENVITQSGFYQTQEPTGEFMFQFNQDEIFYVDLDKKETKWRLPQFGEVASFEAAGALQNIGVLKYNLDIYKQRSHNASAKNEPPEVLLVTENPVVLGEPNILICLATKFFPPVLKMTYLKNNKPLTEGVYNTDFYPAPDGSFRKFLYLGFIPTQEDVYTCSVEHAGLSVNPTNKFWRPDVPSPASESADNMICGLGLAVGIIGIIAGIVLIVKGTRKNNNHGGGH